MKGLRITTQEVERSRSTFYVYASRSFIVSRLPESRRTHEKITRQWKLNLFYSPS